MKSMLSHVCVLFHAFYRLTGRATSTMPGAPLTGTTKASLLQQCVAAQEGLPSLLTRQFHSVAGVSDGKASGDSDEECIRVMTWNTLADGKQTN